MFEKSNLSVGMFSQIVVNVGSFEGFYSPRNIFNKALSHHYKIEEARFPRKNDSASWQALLDAIDFYTIRTDYELLIFSTAQDFSELGAHIPITTLVGEVADEMYQAFRNVEKSNNTQKLPDRFTNNHFNTIAVKVLREGYMPVSFNKGRLVLQREEEPLQRNRFAYNAELEIHKEDPFSKMKMRERWQDLSKQLSP